MRTGRFGAALLACALAQGGAVACDRDGRIEPPGAPPAEMPATPGDDENESRPAEPLPPGAGGARTGAPAAIGEAPERLPGGKYPPVEEPGR
ncbi:MAG: hypothetical protein DCC71_16660 [Proteobacteria bacterium]|nr:MAG: hypothetical protein DCC71_16660 [Pseudomonadota bacterium]